MAIVIEENKNRVNLLTIITWGIILVAVIVVVYYIFFRRPEIIDISVPPNFQNTQEISKINLDPEVITNHPKFQGRQEYVRTPTPGNLGRPNPFLPF